MVVTTALWHFENVRYRISHCLQPLPSVQSCLPASIEVKSSGTTITAASYCLQGAVFTKDRVHRKAGETERVKREREMRLKLSTKGDPPCVAGKCYMCNFICLKNELITLQY